MDCREKISRSFVVAGGDGPILFELAEEILDEMPRFVGVLVEIPLDFAIASERDNERLAAGKQQFDDTFVGVEGLVGQQSVCCHVRQQRVRAFQIMGLARR